MDLSFLAPIGYAKANAAGVYEIPFLDRMGIVFVLSVIGMIIISKYEVSRGVKTNGLEIDRSMFKVTNGFAVGSLMILGMLAALYTIFW